MPFPWKMVKSRRISQLLNDHLHISQKRRNGSSLVVETGFPASLIDLFIKNREKLKKLSKKKLQTQPIKSPINNFDPIIEGPLLSSTSSSPPPPPSLAAPPPLQKQFTPRSLPPLQPPNCANEICAALSSGGGDFNGVLIEVLKIFVVVVLALTTKRLAVGITISAVLFLFFECIGKHCCRLLKRRAAVTPMVQIGVKLVRYKKLELEEEKQEPSKKPVPLPLESSASRYPTQEIQALESMVEIQSENEMKDYEEIEMAELAIKREESISDFTDCKRTSRRAKIKSKMKKIVSKKFRGSKKEQSLQNPPTTEDEDITPFEEQKDNVEASEDGSVPSSISRACHNEKEVDNTGAICSDRRLWDMIEEEEEANTESGIKGCEIEAAVARRHMLICLIVLAGLIGGRPFALMLTLTWSLTLKLGQALHMITSFDVKSG